MLIYQVLLNGELVSRAGATDLSVLTATINSVGQLGPASEGADSQREGMRLWLEVSGLSSRTKLHPNWGGQRELKIGDEVTVQITEGDNADPVPEPSKEAFEQMRRQLADLDRNRFESAKRFYLENRERYES